MKVNKNLSVMKRLVLLPLVLLLSLAAFAQKVSVEGTVTDGAQRADHWRLCLGARHV